MAGSGWLSYAAAALSLLVGRSAVRAQDPPMALPRLTAEVTLDGRPDEPAWDAIEPLPLTMFLPVLGGPPTQRSEIRVAYDDDYLYVSGRFYDTDPDGIRINSLYRDRWNGDDALAIYIDVFNDNRNAKWFGTTPSGMRFEVLVSDDGATLNSSWDTFWDARASITDAGWFAEVRIPFSSLGFQASDGDAVMGLTVTRLVSRLNERVTFPAIPAGREFRQPSVARDVLLRGVRSTKPLYVTPYALTGVQRANELPVGATRVRTARSEPREVGVDLRYPLSSELTLDLTANTDFAQVEADDQQVNLDRFTLFFPEKRRFFQERSELFDFTMGNAGGRLFHSRQIGLAGGVPVPVIGGARLVGRAGDWDIGVLDMQTDAAPESEGENFGVARVKHAVINPYSYIGGMVTTRGGGPAHNIAYGLDGSLRLSGSSYLFAKWAQTFDELDPAGTNAFDRTQAYVSLQRIVTRGLQFDLNAARSGRAYLPRLGFQPRRDFTTANIVGNYYVWTDSHPVLRRVFPGALAFSTFRNSDGALESGQYAVWVQWDTKTGGGGWIEPKLFRENVSRPFSIGAEADSVTIPPGDYTFADLQLALSMGSGRRLRTNVDARAGTYFDGTRAQIILSPTWNLSRHLELGADYQLTSLRFVERDEGIDIHLARLRLRGALDARASGNAFIQYNSTTDRMGVSFRLRYNFSEGTDLWLVYDESLATDRLENDLGLRPPLSTKRALVLKYTHTLRF